VDLAVASEQYARVDVPYRRGETVELVAEESVEGLVDGERVGESPLVARRATTKPRCGSGCGIQSRGLGKSRVEEGP
jgi:hypothetical protein